MEEAAHVDEKTVKLIIWPVASVRGVAVIGISTPTDNKNHYSKLFFLRDSRGKLIFKTIMIGMACDDCQLNNKASSCPHKIGEMPFWKSLESYDFMKMVQTETQFLQETVGVITTDFSGCFPSQLIDQLFSSPRYELTEDETGVVWIAVDPSGGSMNQRTSEMTIMSMTLNSRKEYVVCFCFFFISLLQLHMNHWDIPPLPWSITRTSYHIWV